MRHFDRDKIIEGVKLILEGIGEDPKSDRLEKTPARAANMFEEVLSGTHVNMEKFSRHLTEEAHHEMVSVKSIPIY